MKASDLDDEMCDGSASSVCWFVPPQRHRLVVKVHNPFETHMSNEYASPCIVIDRISFMIMISPGSLGSLGGL